MSTLACLLLSALTAASGYNLEPRHAVVIYDPLYDSESYFGYTLNFWQRSLSGTNTTWLLVGAPRAKVNRFRGERVRQPGGVYKCSLDTVHCSPISVLGYEDTIEQDLAWRGRVKNIPARSWIGATIAVEDKFDGGVAVCAPRMKMMVMNDGWLIPGRCYYMRDEHDISPLALLSTVPFKEGINKNGFLAGLAQVGMSAHFVGNSTNSQLVVGAPGIDYFKGGMAVYEKEPEDPRWQRGRGLSSLHMPKAIQSKFDYYLGYSVTSARFHSNGKVSYVAGAPRGAGLELFSGVVYVLTNHYKVHWTTVSTLKGHQMGEYYGACVTVIDVDQDGTDDVLAVGAPMYTIKSTTEDTLGGDQGRVYVYTNKGEAVLELSAGTVMGSSVAGARFGTSLANIGDINRDGFNDLAVGAPYEGKGAVYIYHGKNGGLNTQYSQRISGSDINENLPLSGLGISISSRIDVDDNSFNDIAVGSYQSANAIIIKSYPVIDFEAYLESSVKKLDTNAANFTVKACLRYTTAARSDLLRYVGAETTVRIDQNLRRATFSDSQTRGNTLTLQYRLARDSFHCWPLIIKLKENIGYVVQPIEISMEYKIKDDASVNREKTFCKMCPVVDPHKPTSIHTKVPFAHGCKEKDVCYADLKVVAQSSNRGKPLVLGRDSKFTVNVTVMNAGEPAYLTKLAFTLPGRNMLAKLPKNCYQQTEVDISTKPQKEVILCNLGNPLIAGTDTYNLVPTGFEVDVSSVPIHTTTLTLNATAWSSSEETKPTDNTAILDIPMKLVSRVDITGNTLQKHVIVGSQGENDTDDIPVVHKYEIINYGPSTIGSVLIRFKIPIAYTPPATNHELLYANLPNPQVVIGGHTFRCDVEYSGLESPDIDSLRASGWNDRDMPQGRPDAGPTDIKDILQRRRRSLTTWSFNDTNTDEFRMRRALYLNCSGDKEVLTGCALVNCEVGPLSSENRAEVNLELFINRTVLGTMLNDVDLIQISSVGRVDILEAEKYDVPWEHRSKVTTVETEMMGEVGGDGLPNWIVPLSIILGLLLLLLLVKCLSNCGFFKRSTKEKLMTMKEKAAEDDFEILNFLDETEDDTKTFNLDEETQ